MAILALAGPTDAALAGTLLAGAALAVARAMTRPSANDSPERGTEERPNPQPGDLP